MAKVEKISVSLSAEIAANVRRAVEAGEYSSSSEVIREALRQWQERRDLLGYTLEELRGLWEEGLASGEARPFTVDTIEQIRESARRRLRAP